MTATLTPEQVFADHRQDVFRLARRLTGDPALAEDIAQDVFVRVILALPTFRGDAHLTTWLYRITMRVAGRHLARRARDRGSQHAQPAVAPDRAEQHVERDAVERAIAALPLARRTVLVLVTLEGFSHAQAAEVLGIPEGTVWSRLHAARKQLAGMLG